jgi:putative transposase
MTRNLEFGIGEHYHIYNRGVRKREIFTKEIDYVRFLFSILHFQSPVTFENIGRHCSYFIKHRAFNIPKKRLEKITKNQYVSLTAFALMPNHFHLIIKCNEDNGVSQYMQRILNSYTKYFNTKYSEDGHLFQGPFRAVYIESNEQLLHLSAYIHKHKTSWSSNQDYLHGNHWGQLLSPEIILDQFSSSKDYGNWIQENPAKDPDYL